MTHYQVIDKKTGEQLGLIEKFYHNIGTLARPEWRVWYRLADRPSVNADVRSILAHYLGQGKKVKTVKV